MHCCTRLIIGTCFSLLAAPLLAADPAPRPAAAAKDQATLDREFTQMLTNVRLVGGYNANDMKEDKKNDGYTILSVRRGEGNEWIFKTQFEYKGVTLPVELSLPVLWAGDTPVLTMTDHQIPGMGSFTVRLIFYDGQYAGTWSSKRHGGQMWGRIEKIEAPKPADPLIQK